MLQSFETGMGNRGAVSEASAAKALALDEAGEDHAGIEPGPPAAISSLTNSSALFLLLTAGKSATRPGLSSFPSWLISDQSFILHWAVTILFMNTSAGKAVSRFTSHQALALTGRGNGKRLTILRNRPSCNVDALLFLEHERDLAVAERLADPPPRPAS